MKNVLKEAYTDQPTGEQSRVWTPSSETNLSPSGFPAFSQQQQGYSTQQYPQQGTTWPQQQQGYSTQQQQGTTWPQQQQGYSTQQQGYSNQQQGYLAPQYSQGYQPQIVTQVEHTHKPAIVRETVVPQQRIEIQPIYHRDIQQTEIHEIVQPMKERDIAPTQVLKTTLPSEVRPEVRRGEAFIPTPTIQPTHVIAPTQTSTFQKPAIVEEKVHKRVIEEIQPVLYKEVIQPTLVEQVRPIYETYVEAPRVVLEERAVRDLGVVHIGGSSQAYYPASTQSTWTSESGIQNSQPMSSEWRGKEWEQRPSTTERKGDWVSSSTQEPSSYQSDPISRSMNKMDTNPIQRELNKLNRVGDTVLPPKSSATTEYSSTQSSF